jgi:hypothetical protein
MRNPALGFSQVAKPTTANSMNLSHLRAFLDLSFELLESPTSIQQNPVIESSAD